MRNNNKPLAHVRPYRVSTSVGVWRVAFSDLGIRELSLPSESIGKVASKLPELKRQEGEPGRFFLEMLKRRLGGKACDLPWNALDLSGRPPFFTRVWKAMRSIPFGRVRSYGWLASKAGSPLAVRATGQACGSNPVVLFIPCHRVVAANGPGGFGSGMAWKRRLLSLEGYDLSLDV